MLAYVPARGGSKRIPGKNLAEVGGKPLVAHVLDCLATCDFVNRVCVSTDCEKTAEIVRACGAVTGELRKQNLADDFATFVDLLREDLPRFLGDEKEVLFVLPTAALVTPGLLQAAHDHWSGSTCSVLAAGTGFDIPPQWAMVKGNDGYWVPMMPAAQKVRSQDLPETLVDAGLFYFLRWNGLDLSVTSLMENRHLGFIRIPREVAIDVDTPEDLETLRARFSGS